MANSLNVRLINNVTDIAQGDTASTVILELLDENKLTIPTLNGKSALINFINKKNEIQYQYTTFVFDSRVEFNVDSVIPHGTYNVEVRIQADGFSYVFPSSVNYTLRINKSANDFYNIAINQNGVDLIVSEVYQRLDSENPGLLDHVKRKDNPHAVTKGQIGLGNVDNVKQASKADLDKHVDDTAVHTTRAEKDKLAGIEAGAQKNTITKVNGKTGDITLDKADVGLANVANVEQAAKADLDSHVKDTTAHVSSSERTKWNSKYDKPSTGIPMSDMTEEVQEILLSAPTDASIQAHVNDKENPHGVTKAQVGLGNVQNYSVATEAEAREGTVNNKYMTPLSTKQAIESLGGSGGGGEVSIVDVPLDAAYDNVTFENYSCFRIKNQVHLVTTFTIAQDQEVPAGFYIFTLDIPAGKAATFVSKLININTGEEETVIVSNQVTTISGLSAGSYYFSGVIYVDV